MQFLLPVATVTYLNYGQASLLQGVHAYLLFYQHLLSCSNIPHLVVVLEQSHPLGWEEQHSHIKQQRRSNLHLNVLCLVSCRGRRVCIKFGKEDMGGHACLCRSFQADHCHGQGIFWRGLEEDTSNDGEWLSRDNKRMWSPILFVTGNDKIGVSGIRIELVKVQQNVEFQLILAGVNCRWKCFDFRWKSERDSQRPTRIFFISVRDFCTIRPTLTVSKKTKAKPVDYCFRSFRNGPARRCCRVQFCGCITSFFYLRIFSF